MAMLTIAVRAGGPGEPVHVLSRQPYAGLAAATDAVRAAARQSMMSGTETAEDWRGWAWQGRVDADDASGIHTEPGGGTTVCLMQWDPDTETVEDTGLKPAGRYRLAWNGGDYPAPGVRFTDRGPHEAEEALAELDNPDPSPAAVARLLEVAWLDFDTGAETRRTVALNPPEPPCRPGRWEQTPATHLWELPDRDEDLRPPSSGAFDTHEVQCCIQCGMYRTVSTVREGMEESEFPAPVAIGYRPADDDSHLWVASLRAAPEYRIKRLDARGDTLGEGRVQPYEGLARARFHLLLTVRRDIEDGSPEVPEKGEHWVATVRPAGSSGETVVCTAAWDAQHRKAVLTQTEPDSRYLIVDTRAGGWRTNHGPAAADRALVNFETGTRWTRVRSEREKFLWFDFHTAAETIVERSLHPVAPKCFLDHNDRVKPHRWERPHEVVGGSSAEPGVWRGGHPNGTNYERIDECCSNCGRYRTVITERLPGGGTVETREYREDDERSRAWQAQIAEWRDALKDDDAGAVDTTLDLKDDLKDQPPRGGW